MKSLDSEKVELLNNYFADIGEDLAKHFMERVNGDDNSYISRITPICKEIQTDIKLLNPISNLGGSFPPPNLFFACNFFVLEPVPPKFGDFS